MIVIGFGCILSRHEFMTRHFPHGSNDGPVADPAREELRFHHVIPFTLSGIRMREGFEFHTDSGCGRHE